MDEHDQNGVLYLHQFRSYWCVIQICTCTYPVLFSVQDSGWKELKRNPFCSLCIATAWSHQHPKSVVLGVSRGLQILWQSHCLLIGGATEIRMMMPQVWLSFLSLVN